MILRQKRFKLLELNLPAPIGVNFIYQFLYIDCETKIVLNDFHQRVSFHVAG